MQLIDFLFARIKIYSTFVKKKLTVSVNEKCNFFVNIAFNNKKLEEYANSDKKGKKALGDKVFKKYKQRLDQLAAAITLEDLRHVPGKYHELRENRKGQWACSLVGKDRLIFEPQEDPIPTNDNGQYCWDSIKAVNIIEIVDYH